MSILNDSPESEIRIVYPETHPGAAETRISFHAGAPDAAALYAPGSDGTRRRCFVTDATVATIPALERFIGAFDDGVCGGDILIILGSGEPYKTIDSVLTIIQTAIEAGFSRTDLFVGIGGGVICDLTGFAASLFKRGAPVHFVPTTLLAMVDASIGGKTGCDFNSYKNMIGAFYPAQEISIFPEFLQTLSDDQFRSGLAEALKTALLYDKELFGLFKDGAEKIKRRDPQTLFTIIQKCAQAKAAVVEQDFMEKGARMFLNFGHSFGHALETVAGLGAIAHGDAVAWGMGRALALCAKKEFCTERYKDEVFSVLKEYGWNTDAIPQSVIGGGIAERLLAVMHKDKKNQNSKIRLVLQRGINDTFTQEMEDADILAVLKPSARPSGI